MKIVIIGTGYVGLITGTCLADTGNTVTCVDVDKPKIKALQKEQVDIYEPNLKQLLKRGVKQKRLLFTTQLEECIGEAELVFMALPTPAGENGETDLKYLLQAVDQISPLLKQYTIIVNKSTVPVGTAEIVEKRIAAQTKEAFDVVSNPEFLREGNAVEDFMKPDRVIVGTGSERARAIMERLYSPFVRQGNAILFMDRRSAELSKYAANSFLAMKISFMNEMANLSERVGANIDDVRKGIGTDNRIGRRFLFSGIGYGGSCFPKDVWGLEKTASKYNYDFKILKSVMEVNQIQRTILLPQIKTYFQGDLRNKVIAFWGLSFKPDTDDIREAPSLDNIDQLLKEGVIIQAHDPEAMKHVQKIWPHQIKYYATPYEAAAGADAIFIATEWHEFKTLDFQKLSTLLKSKVIFDGRNLYDLNIMQQEDYTYISIGRKAIHGKSK